MDSSDGRYGWAADDPRWTDAPVAGPGRLEPPPPPVPRFGLDDTVVGGLPAQRPPAPERPSGGWVPAAPPPAAQLPAWPPSEPATAVRPGLPPAPAAEPPTWPPLPAASPAVHAPAAYPPEPFPAPLAISAGPVSPPEVDPVVPRPRADGYAPYGTPTAPPPPPAPGPRPDTATAPAAVPAPVVPFTIHTRYPAPAPVRPGYGLNPAATASVAPSTTYPAAPATSAADLQITQVTSRLERKVRRGRRRGDEFRQAGRAELFSDDARYPVLFSLTAAWYAPVALIFLVWTLAAGGEVVGARLLTGLAWLVTATAISLAVTALLRWASVGWRALTLSIAAALIGGAVTAIAQGLSG